MHNCAEVQFVLLIGSHEWIAKQLSFLTTGPGVGRCNYDSEINHMLEIEEEQQTVIMVCVLSKL